MDKETKRELLSPPFIFGYTALVGLMFVIFLGIAPDLNEFLMGFLGGVVTTASSFFLTKHNPVKAEGGDDFIE